MSTSKSKQQVRPEQKVRKIAKIAQAEAGISRRSDGLIPFFATASLPSASGLPNGCLVWDSDVAAMKMTASGSWVVIA